MKRLLISLTILVSMSGCRTNTDHATDIQAIDSVITPFYSEQYRPQIHFSPKEKWMNDPNGMVYYKGAYHLFYQYYPESKVWGPMHWGHARSNDLVHWANLPIALYPDSLGLIFSGSAVADLNNTSGFGTKGNPPLVAMFTYHSQEKEKAGRTDYQYQGIAYSVDDGNTWTKYEGNPVIRNPGSKDFRDPKVFWHEQTKKWLVIMAVKDHTEIWASENLKTWNKLSDFGFDFGSHGGVWECPDLFEITAEGENKSKWVMIVSINPGGPNGGSATQYFVGDFDGKDFKADLDKSITSWIDYGPDDYAGVTWSNISDGRKIFLGWMSNWAYAQEVPTDPWRSANTCPRELSLVKLNGRLYVRSKVAREFMNAAKDNKVIPDLTIRDSLNVSEAGDVSKSIITAAFEAGNFEIVLSNPLKQNVAIGFDPGSNQFYINRSASGKIDFSKHYPVKLNAKRISSSDKINLTLVTDVSSVEIFFDDGITNMTSLFFADRPLTDLTIVAPNLKVKDLTIRKMSSIW